MTNTDIIEGFNVGLRVDHPRISDLAFTLVSPAGARYALMENRGAYSADGCGTTIVTTNFVNVTPSGNGAPDTNFINVGVIQGTLPIGYDFYSVADEMTVYYGTNVTPANLILDTGFTNNPGTGPNNIIYRNITVPFGPTNGIVSTYLTIIMNQFGNPAGTNGTSWIYHAGGIQTNFFYLRFTEDTNLTTTPIKYAVPPFVPAQTNYSEVWTDSFEAYPRQTILQGSTFGSWTVLTNQVVIATNPPATDGTNLLVLGNGAVSNTLPTIPGRKYILQYSVGAQPFTGLYVANYNDDTIEEFTLPYTNGSTFFSGLNLPDALAFDFKGNLYEADSGANQILKITPGGTMSVFANTGNDPAGLAFDVNGNLYVANFVDNTIQKITPAGVVSTFETDIGGTGSVLNGPRGLAFDASGKLYVANFGDGTIGSCTIRIFSAPNTAGALFVTEADNSSPAALAFDNTGTNLWVANYNNTTVVEYQTPITNIVNTLLGFVAPSALVFDGSDDLFIADAYGGSSGIIYESTSGGVPTIFTTDGLNTPFGLAYYSNINPEATNSAGWQARSLTFTATQTGTPLVLDASRSGFAAGTLVPTNFSAQSVFDAFSLTLIPSELYYQAEQSLAPIIGTSAFGDWEMEVLDRRTGATSTNASLVSWQLEFIFANTNQAIAALGTLSGGTAANNSLGAAGLGYYVVNVPPQASFATNLLINASSPVNVWFSTAFPPTITSPGDVDLIPNSINNIATPAILSTNGSPVFPGPPNIIPGSTYYLVIQNLTNAPVTFNVKVNFDVVGQLSSLHFSGVKTSASHPQMSWVPGFGGHYQIQWADQFTSPMVWHTITNPVTTTVHGTSTFTDNGTQTAPLGAKRFYRLVKTK